MALNRKEVSENTYFTILNQKDQVTNPLEMSRGNISKFLEEAKKGASTAKGIGDVESIEVNRKILVFWDKYNKRILDLIMEINSEFADIADDMYSQQVKQMDRERGR